MAKKNVEKTSSEMSIEERLKNLYQLQTILTEIDNIRTIRGELPLEVQDLEDEVEGLHTRIEKTRSEAEEISKAIVALRGEIEESKMKIDNYQQQIDNVRNSREYDLINKEIEFKNLEIQLAEKKINEAKVAEARKQELIQKSEEELDNRTQDLELKKNELVEIRDVTHAESRSKGKNQMLVVRCHLHGYLLPDVTDGDNLLKVVVLSAVEFNPALGITAREYDVHRLLYAIVNNLSHSLEPCL